jgi:hypothetical protein|tara:strand:+ start:1685 stop:1945 length:261 start_codon:yes stop_codon:yes gene_type:complete
MESQTIDNVQVPRLRQQTTPARHLRRALPFQEICPAFVSFETLLGIRQSAPKDVGFIKKEKTYYSKTKRLIQQVMELTKCTSKKGK